MSLQDATDVFCRSFAFTRTFTHPFEFVRIGDLRVLRDATVRKTPRCQEIVVCGVTPESALAQTRSYDPPRHVICVITDEPDYEPLKVAYKAGGYRMLGSEHLYMRDLSSPINPARIEARRVTTWEEASQVATAACGRQILLDQIGGSQVRLYSVWCDGLPVGWVRSIHLEPDSTWVSNLHVRAEYRRAGIASGLMTALLVDDREAGAKHSVLLASHVGSMLYPTLGYERIGTLLLFAPLKQ